MTGGPESSWRMVMACKKSSWLSPSPILWGRGCTVAGLEPTDVGWTSSQNWKEEITCKCFVGAWGQVCVNVVHGEVGNPKSRKTTRCELTLIFSKVYHMEHCGDAVSSFLKLKFTNCSIPVKFFFPPKSIFLHNDAYASHCFSSREIPEVYVPGEW